MRGREPKREMLHRSNSMLHLGPAGHNIFVSKEKQMRYREARRLQLWMKVVFVLLVLVLCAAVGMIVLFGVAPWLRSEMTLNRDTASSSPESSAVSVVDEVLEYDALGLPVYSDSICLFVVNPDNPAEETYVPKLTEVSGVQVEAHAADALRALLTAAEEDGLSIMLSEGYVSYGQQEKRFREKVQQLQQEQGLSAVMANSAAMQVEPQPGQSDFQSGMTIRLAAGKDTFAQSRTYSWLKTNMGKYGFVFRYPEYKEDYTGVTADLTVIRYVGSAAASAMQQRSMCLEEYLAYLESQ